MWKPTDIYKTFSRELLENFVWQLQSTKEEYWRALCTGLEPGSRCAFTYSFECPSEKAAQSLHDYICEQVEEISIEQRDGAWFLTGRSEELGFELDTILGWVGYMCEVGSQSGCRFDGWSPVPVATADESTDEDDEDEDDDDEEDEEEVVAPEPAGPWYPHMVIAKILDSIEPMARAEKYEDPLTAVLQERRLGKVTGGGSQLNAKFEVAYVDIEIRLADLDRALELTKKTLRKLGAPKGSELRFTREVVIPIVD
jgi:hypothetical protein